MRSISISSGSRSLAVVGLLTCSLLFSCGKRNGQGSSASKEPEWNQEQAELQYRVLQAELKLAQSSQAYLVLDFQRDQLEIKVQGATVWNYPMTIEKAEASELHEFSERFMGSEQNVVRPLLFKYLFAASGRTPDSILAIISGATMFPPELLQRTVPERFELKWSEDIVLDVRTDVVGKPESKWKNTIVEIRRAIAGSLGDAYVTVRMPKDNAITLYRAAVIGLPTLIYPAS
jgi:hypothetical protein